MQDFTSILNIIFIISGGVLTFVILFIFAKRQITRFALRSRRGPHVPIGTDAKKVNYSMYFKYLKYIVLKIFTCTYNKLCKSYIFL